MADDDAARRLREVEEKMKHRLDKLKDQAPPASETVELSEASQAAVERQKELKETIEKRKRARELAVPTNDNAVKLKLRESGEPISLFGEIAPDRRERLREVMAANLDLDMPDEGLRGGETLASRKAQAIRRSVADPTQQDEDQAKAKELFYTEGDADL